jgi:hypothetical protein
VHLLEDGFYSELTGGYGMSLMKSVEIYVPMNFPVVVDSVEELARPLVLPFQLSGTGY